MDCALLAAGNLKYALRRRLVRPSLVSLDEIGRLADQLEDASLEALALEPAELESALSQADPEGSRGSLL